MSLKRSTIAAERVKPRMYEPVADSFLHGGRDKEARLFSPGGIATVLDGV